ncbi:uncharacterized protein I303_108349 [Kwoniella dejecticola CBS 10117]|uniref:Uncharacterized protein n=1 Tax=Kwoniella dejecticola CBS 10117 TaxID=1296121 RepID=A0A1A5ZXN1_9TREE|nr:uncharacterized protein I303_07323 [Kwoniella dejecticola CBS 10117]OBR82563.1 hypothetical protein I303_07323 [Kwoniella dejecticola CBS 10117]
MPPVTLSSLPRLNTQPVPPTPLTAQNTSAPASRTILQDLPSVFSPVEAAQPSSQESDPFTYDAKSGSDDSATPNMAYPRIVASNGNSLESPSATPRSVLLSPLKTSPTNRPLSPDLPTRDALYLFSNFSSYMRSPNQGPEGLKADDFKDSIRLLEHARWLTSQPHANVHILHLKYRFQGENATFRSPYSTGDYQLPINYKDSIGRIRNPVPQPFSVLHDPVVKIDYMENGVFDPLPAQAVFSHIAKMCQPPPRVIVISYVYSKVIENHLSSLATWALTSSPPSYIFSPLETRLREPQPLHVALGNSIPMSMYAWPNELYSPGQGQPQASSSPSRPSSSYKTLSNAALSPLSPITSIVNNDIMSPSSNVRNTGVISCPPSALSARRRKRMPGGRQKNTIETNDQEDEEDDEMKSPILLTRRISGTESTDDMIDRYYARRTSHTQSQMQAQTRPRSTSTNAHADANLSTPRGRSYPDDPIASLTVIASPSPPKSSSLQRARSHESIRDARHHLPGNSMSTPMTKPIDRIPLWHLAPGIGILHGSTSASIGIKLSDFSAINFANESSDDRTQGTGIGISKNHAQKGIKKHQIAEMGISTTPLLVEEAGPGFLENPLNISRPSSTNPVGIPPTTSTVIDQNQTTVNVHDNPTSTSQLNRNSLENVPLDMDRLTPPNPHIANLTMATNGQNAKVSVNGNIAAHGSQSWPAPISRVPGWRKGRKDMMEDTLEEMGIGMGMGTYTGEIPNQRRDVLEEGDNGTLDSIRLNYSAVGLNEMVQKQKNEEDLLAFLIR